MWFAEVAFVHLFKKTQNQLSLFIIILLIVEGRGSSVVRQLRKSWKLEYFHINVPNEKCLLNKLFEL